MTAITFDAFAAEVAAVAEIPSETIGEETRLIGDLNLDSLALTELVVMLIEKFDMSELGSGLDDRAWSKVTVRNLYDEFLTGQPAGMVRG